MVVSPSLDNVDRIVDFSVKNHAEIRIYKRRYWMIFLYCILAMFGSMTFLLYASVANQTGCYYSVSQNAVNWTTQIFLAVYLILVVPTCFLMDYLDIRSTLILASFLQTSASFVQFSTLKPENFIFVIVVSFLNAVSSMLVLGLAPYIAARWFPSSEISRACVFAMIGTQLGVALGAIVLPLFIPQGCLKIDEIEDGKRTVAYLFTIANTIILILLVFTFQNKPPNPPVAAKMKEEEMSFKQTFRTILKITKNFNYILIFILSGIMGGVMSAFTTTANDLIIKFFPEKEVEIAAMNTLFVLMGIPGSLGCGYILDYTHRFKETTVVYCLMSLLFFLMFSGVLYLKKLWIQFISIALLGFFQGGFLPLGLEYAIEVTYPESEMISSNLEFWSLQLFGIILIQIVSRLLDNFGEVYSNSAIVVSLLICVLISIFLSTDYKRSKKVQEEQRNEGI